MTCPDQDDEPMIATGVAALLRRHPQRVRKAAAAMIAGGVLLFVAASIVLPAGAQPQHNTAAPVAAPPAVLAPADLGATPREPAPAMPVVNNVLARTPRHVAKKAPSTKAVISGLAANGIPNIALNAYRVAAARLANAEPGCGIDWALLAGIGREESDHGRFAGAALNAYRVAAARLANAEPGCGIDWALLAGIGREESDHGRFAGAALNADGTSTPPIVGIPLDGNGTARIGDTDGGRLDGDTVYDRAVGPMQFIPSTWAAYGSDANGDGRADAFNINDAALTAARYLCAAGGDLRTSAGQIAAVLAYNYSDQYLAQVLALASAYRSGVPVYGLPVGNTTGGLPPVNNTGYVPPANPGPPTAVAKPAPKKVAAKKAAAAPKQAARTTAPPGGGSRGTTGSGTPGAGGSSGGTTGATAPGSQPPPVSAPAPIPTPSKTCILWDLLDPHKCDLYG